MKNICLFFVIAFFLLSCSKEAGEGGTSVIEGRVLKYQISESFFDTIIDGVIVSYPQTDTVIPLMPDEGVDVFIIYSSNENKVYDDNFETDWDGRYRFEYLRKGDYTLYIVDDSTSVIGNSIVEHDYPVFRHITISSNGSTNTVDDFVIEKD